MRYKKLLCFVILTLAIGITAVKAQKMYVKEKSGLKTEFLISEISKVQFSATKLNVIKKDKSSASYLINNLGNIKFNLPTGITPEITNAGDNDFINIYPNPVTDYINVKLSSTSMQGNKIEILSIAGSVIYSKELEQFTNEYSIKADFLPDGIYFCRANNGKTIKTVKFLKQ